MGCLLFIFIGVFLVILVLCSSPFDCSWVSLGKRKKNTFLIHFLSCLNCQKVISSQNSNLSYTYILTLTQYFRPSPNTFPPCRAKPNTLSCHLYTPKPHHPPSHPLPPQVTSPAMSSWGPHQPLTHPSEQPLTHPLRTIDPQLQPSQRTIN